MTQRWVGNHTITGRGIRRMRKQRGLAPLQTAAEPRIEAEIERLKSKYYRAPEKAEIVTLLAKPATGRNYFRDMVRRLLAELSL